MVSAAPATLLELIARNAHDHPGAVCFQRETGSGWIPVTHRQFHAHIQALARFLRALGIAKSERVGILASTRYEWEVADKAIQWLGAVSVGLDPRASPAQLARIAREADLRALFAEDERTLALLPAACRTRLGGLCFFERPETDAANSFWDQIERYRTGPDTPPAAGAEDLAALVFTSGTTGEPKGIPFCHGQFMLQLPELAAAFLTHDLPQSPTTLAWMPLHNGSGRMIGTVAYFLGARQYFVSDPRDLSERVRRLEPTYLVVVPRVLEKACLGLRAALRQRSWWEQLWVAVLLFLRPRLPGRRLRACCDRLGLGRLRAAVWGRRLRFLISGSAPADPGILRFFDALGVPTCEVYGQSECAALISMNRPGEIRYGSVGRPLKVVEVKLAADQEILIKTAAALPHYWRAGREELYDEQGFLRTGDLGFFHAGRLYIAGRKKELIKTSTGLRIAPAAVEAVYNRVRGIEQAVVIGNGRKYLTALVTVQDALRRELEVQGRDLKTYLAREFKRRSGRLAPAWRIKRFIVLPRPFSVAEGDLTSMLKLRREILERKHAALIAALYEEPAG